VGRLTTGRTGEHAASRKTKKEPSRRRAVPQRTCVGCRTVKAKREMLRVVRTLAGTVEIDPTGKLAGRGAYLCRQASCWEQALKRRSLDHALKVALDAVTQAKLIEYIQTLPVQLDQTPAVES